MHTFHDYATGVTIHYNSDLSGDCIVQRPCSDCCGKPDVNEVRVPGRALLDFVAQYIVGERIAKLEQAETEDVLGVKVPR